MHAETGPLRAAGWGSVLPACSVPAPTHVLKDDQSHLNSDFVGLRKGQTAGAGAVEKCYKA